MRELDTATSFHIPQHGEVIEHCPYYVVCVRQTMRLCPSAPTMMPQVVSKGGIELDGKLTREGVEISCGLWVSTLMRGYTGRMRGYYPGSGGLSAREYNKDDMAFGYGALGCLGRHIALMELHEGPLQVSLVFGFLCPGWGAW